MSYIRRLEDEWDEEREWLHLLIRAITHEWTLSIDTAGDFDILLHSPQNYPEWISFNLGKGLSGIPQRPEDGVVEAIKAAIVKCSPRSL